ncbi:MAG: Flp family type IVb pilin [Pseudomonadota bacterium]
MNRLAKTTRALLQEDDGAQIVEYALIIAVVSISLTIALGGMNGSAFANMVERTTACLTTSTCT